MSEKFQQEGLNKKKTTDLRVVITVFHIFCALNRKSQKLFTLSRVNK